MTPYNKKKGGKILYRNGEYRILQIVLFFIPNRKKKTKKKGKRKTGSMDSHIRKFN